MVDVKEPEEFNLVIPEQSISNKECEFRIYPANYIGCKYKSIGSQIPEELINIILTVCEGQFDMVYDPFCGSGTTLKVALDKGYKIMGADIDEKAIEITKKRLIRLRENACISGGKNGTRRI